MLSILIPAYNYNVYPLVCELHKQCVACGIDFEIIVLDDGSKDEFSIKENSKINLLENCSYSINLKNLGRGKNINALCSKSKYNYVLIMEADSFTEDKSYIKNYVDLITRSTTVIFGGVKYSNITPPKEKKLRWKYGIIRETKSLNYRLKKKYDFVFTWNLLLKKEILSKYPFPEFISEYGYEDAIFIKNLHLNCISILHIENYLIHLNDELSIDFIKKSERAVNTLYDLINQQRIDYKDVKLSRVYLILKKIYLIGLVKSIYSKMKQQILNNLTSENPNLYLLDFYKLGYYCTFNKSKNV